MKKKKESTVKYYKVVSEKYTPIFQTDKKIVYKKGVYKSDLCEDDTQECAEGIYFLTAVMLPMWWDDGTKNTRKLIEVKPLGKVIKVAKGFRTNKLQVVKVLTDSEVADLGKENGFTWYMSTQTSGDMSTQTSGYMSTQTSGYMSTQTSGDRSTQTSGYMSTQTSGDMSTQTSGYMSTQTSGYMSTQTSGYRSTQTSGDRSTQTSGDRSTQTSGYRSTQTSGDRSTQTSGYMSTQTSGDWSTLIAWGKKVYHKKLGKHIILRQIWNDASGDYTHAILDIDVLLKDFSIGDVVKIEEGIIKGKVNFPKFTVGQKVKMIVETCSHGGNLKEFTENGGSKNEAVIQATYMEDKDINVKFKNGDTWAMTEDEVELIQSEEK